MTESQHPQDLLPEFVAGRLPEEAAAAVRTHLDSCRECAVELEAWRAVALASSARVAAAAPARLGTAVLERVVAESQAGRGDARAPRAARVARGRGDARAPRARARIGWLWSFLRAQAPIVRREIWPASAVIMAIGAAISLLTTRGPVPGAALSLFAPLAAALGIALIYGEENDPALELAVATPTSPRLVVVARLVVVLAWDLALALGATAVLAAVDGPAIFLPLVGLWLGPMLLLGSFTLVLSLFVGTSVSIGIGGAIWVLRALQVAGEVGLNRVATLGTVMDVLWQTTPVTLAAAGLLLLFAIAIVPRRGGLAGATN